MHSYSGLDLKKIILLSKNAKFMPTGILLGRDSSVTFNIVHKTNCTLSITKAVGSDNTIIVNGVTTSLGISKSAQINLSNLTQLVIDRDRKSLGSLLITSVSLDIDGNENHELFYKLGKTSGITVDSNGIYADESAQIYEKDRMESLEVYPPGSYVVKDTIVFNRSAKIIDVKLKDNGNKMAEIYSNDNLAMFANGNDLKASGNNLILERGSCLGIKDMGQTNGEFYILELGLSNIVGNGIFLIQTMVEGRIAGTQNGIIFNTSCKTYKFKIVIPSARNYHFNICRDTNSSTGSIMIHSIKLYGETLGKIELRDYNTFQAEAYDQISNVNIKKTMSSYCADIQEEDSFSHNKISSHIKTTSDLCRYYISKNIDIFTSSICMTSIDKISEVDVQKYNVVYIETFDRFKNIQGVKSKIFQCRNIVTPSLFNKVMLSSINKNVEIGCFPIPISNFEYTKNNKYLYIDLNKSITNEIYSKYSDKITIVTDSSYDTETIKTNDFDTIIRFMFGCSGIILLDTNSFYMSRYAEICKCIGVDIYTNNCNYINCSNFVRVDFSDLSSIDIKFLETSSQPNIDREKLKALEKLLLRSSGV